TADRWELVGGRVRLPAGTRSVHYRFDGIRGSGGANSSYLDNAFLYVQADTVAPDHGAYGNIDAQNAENLNTHLALRFPDLYTDWEKFQPHTIRWDTYNNAQRGPVSIDLYQDGPNGPQFLVNIASAAPDTGSYVWIPGNSGIDYG